MKSFEYASPTNTESAVELLGEGATVFAGGNDLLALMKDSVVSATRLVNIKEIPDLQGIQDDGDQGIRIGAVTTLAELCKNVRIKEEYPALWEAAAGIRSPQIHTVATVGGNLCQRPRCWYFRNGYGLLAMKDGKSMVVEGDNRYHAILGNSGPAYFASPSSLAVALIALDATMTIQGSSGSRTIPVEDFYRIPQSSSEMEYDLAADEIVTEIQVPEARNKKSTLYKVRALESMAWPLVLASVSLEMSGNSVSSARVVLGQVAPKPWVAEGAAAAITGKAVTAENADAAGQAAVADAKPLSKNRYKVQLTRVAVKRAIMQAAGMEV